MTESPLGSCVVYEKTAGTNRPMTARMSSAALDAAIFALNDWVPKRKPPASAAAPVTSSRFPMIDPVSDALTTSKSPAWSAKNAMMSSAMLPKVALRIPPTCGPVSDPSRSVDAPTTHASPRIEAADAANTSVSSACRPNSRRIVSRLRPTVPSSTTLATGES